MNMTDIYRGKRKDNGEWVYGFYFCMHHNDDRNHIHHFIIPLDTEIPKEKPIGDIQIEVIPETVGLNSSSYDISGRLMYAGDVFEAHHGTQTLAITMILRYGKYQAYCPEDKTFMDNVGFYVEAQGYADMPMGDTATYAKVIGNIHDNPELLDGGDNGEKV